MSKEKFKRKIRRAAAAIAALALAVSFTFPAGTDIMGVSFGNAIVASADTVTSGNCGSGVEWKLDDAGKLTISYTGSGSGAMYDWDMPDYVHWYSYSGSIKSVVIEQGVTSIGDLAFVHCSSLKSISIPNSVTSIGKTAFSGCTILTSITIPNSVTSIGDGAFVNCSSLTSITIPSSVNSIGRSAFNGCTRLTSITIPNSITSIGEYAFYNCTSLTSITIPDSVNSIGYAAFNGCSSLTSITIPDSVNSIGDFAFQYCSSLTSITIPNSVTSIGKSAFYDCSSLTSITIPNGVNSIENHAFDGCYSLTSITIPEGVNSIENYAFDGCFNLTSIFLPEGLTSIGTNAIPTTATRVKYTVSDDEVTITEMTNVSEGQKVDIPEKISGYPVVSVAADYQKYVGNHTHYFSNNICGLCSGAEYVTGITVSPDTLSFTVGDPASQLTATVLPTNAVDTSVEWTSSDTSVAAVDDSGNVTAVGRGTATIKATAKDGSGIYGECAVTVLEVPCSAFYVAATNSSDTLIYGQDYTYPASTGVLTILSDKAMTIANASSGATTDRIEVANNISANITLAGVNIDVSGTGDPDMDVVGSSAFKIADDSTGNVTITLADGSENTLKSGYRCAGLQKNGGINTGKLTIKGGTNGTGKLTAIGGNSGAGIGGDLIDSGSNIEITGGNVIAASVFYGAGIGGGSDADGSNITISGGTVTATGGQYGAGIGGGWQGSGSNIKISGGTVTANGVHAGAGIGGGVFGEGSDITISGGTVTANGGEYGAGIGGGYSENGSDIIISGGTVTANGGDYGAGIGGGYYSEGSDITITGGTVTANGGLYGAGIGDGFHGEGSHITITGGSVKAVAGSGANAIGGGYGCGEVTPTNGSNNVYLLELDNAGGTAAITINDRSYPTNHNGEEKIYAYLPAKSLSDPNKVTVGNTTTYCYYDTINSTWINIIDAVTIEIAEPTAGSALATSATVTSPDTGVETITPSDIVWKDASDSVVSGTAEYNKEYTVYVTLKAAWGYAFNTDVGAAVNTNGTAMVSENNGDTITVSYQFDPTEQGTVKTPTASPLSGTYTENQSVELSCATQGAAIYYTTDGTVPTTSSTQYTGPISVTGTAGQSVTTTIKAIAVKDGMQDSAAATFTYTIEIPAVTHTITATAGAGGSISPSGAVTVADNDDQTFTITPDSGYEIDTLTVDNVVVTSATSYTFANVTEDHTISVTFKFKQSHTNRYDIIVIGNAYADKSSAAAGETVNVRTDFGYDIIVTAENGQRIAKITEKGSFTMPASKVYVTAVQNETFALMATAWRQSYVYSYDSDMNKINVNSTKKRGIITVTLGKEYAGKSFTIYSGRKSTKVKVTEGEFDENGKFVFEVPDGKNYTLVVED